MIDTSDLISASQYIQQHTILPIKQTGKVERFPCCLIQMWSIESLNCSQISVRVHFEISLQILF
ncbi:MAG: hypothetical protein DKT66_25570 [Candidatus Melainabacteria bacterium]|nr:MAG: hypothetical protein DKT66_25570 [Candidatus Melainabacteria bacterium]